MTTTSKTRRPLQLKKAVGERLKDQHLPVNQAGQIFEQIAALAWQADRVGYWNGADTEADQCHDSITTMRILINQIGLLADVGAEKLDSMTMNGTQAEDWLMPPVYPRTQYEDDQS